MPKAVVRDGIAPAVIFDPNIGAYQAVHPGKTFEIDDPFVAEHRELFDRGVEQATAAPGEKRNTKRAS